MPIGIEDYAVAQNYYYVDKTDLIKEIIDTYIGKSVLVTRPRRFGKSLNLSILEQFFSNKYSSLNNFKNRNIYTRKDICDEYLNSYPVYIYIIFINYCVYFYNNIM